MKKLSMMFILAACFLLLFEVSAEMRIWTSIKGETIEAEYITMVSGKVVLKTSAGKQIKVPMSGLCAADHKYLISAIPPKLKISVDVDVDRDKQGDGYYYETTDEAYTITITIEKTNKEESDRKLTARAYMVAETKNNKGMLIGYSSHDFSFMGQSTAEFSVSGDVSSTQSYWSNHGYEYEGYLILVESEDGKVIAMESNQNRFEKNVRNLKKARKGDQLSKSLTVVKK